MTNRITRVMVTLHEPVQISELNAPIPAGRYEVTTEEEPIGDFMFPAYRRISTSIYLPRVPGRIGVGQAVLLNQTELDGLLGRADGLV
jgi:hypothetical protein